VGIALEVPSGDLLPSSGGSKVFVVQIEPKLLGEFLKWRKERRFEQIADDLTEPMRE
jgi:hypothetical protein